MNGKLGKKRRITPEGEPLEDAGGGGGFPGSFFRRGSGGIGNGKGSNSLINIIIPAVVGLIIIAFLIINSVKIVDAGNRGVLLHFGAVDVSRSLDEGIHFVVPVRDNVVQMEVRTQKIVEDTVSASQDLQDVSTQVALNYHLDPDNTQVVYRQLGIDYSNRMYSDTSDYLLIYGPFEPIIDRC